MTAGWMMKRTFTLVALIGLLLTFLPGGAAAEEEGLSAVGFSLHGYYRIRYDNMFDLSWISEDEDDDSDWWSYIDQRMLLQPSLIISDPI